MGKRVMILAGGTGGHVYPALAVARELQSRGHDVAWMGTRAGLEARVVPAAGIAMEWLSVSGLRGKGLKAKCAAPFMLIRACLQARGILRKVRPHVVVGLGGFVSGPGGLMARLLGIPLVLHEQNRVPGTTNRWLAPWAKVVLEAFPESFPASAKARCTGNPLRRELAALHGTLSVAVSPGVTRILVLGGSQGAKALNEALPEALAKVGLPLEILHQTGTATRDATAERYAKLGLSARVEAFIEDMAAAYRSADLVVCRSGAMTVSELAAAGLPAVLVPFPHAIDDHQTRNAEYLADAGAAVLLPQNELTAERLAEAIRAVAVDPEKLKEMARRAAALARPDAAQSVAAICLAEAKA